MQNATPIREPQSAVETATNHALIYASVLSAHGSSEHAKLNAFHHGDGASERLVGQKILVIEDEIIVGMDLKMSLEDCGAIVIGPVTELPAASEIAQSVDADAAILDINLMGQAVFPVADILVQRGIPFLFHTGNADLAPLSGRYPDAQVLKKPVDMQKLLQTVARFL